MNPIKLDRACDNFEEFKTRLNPTRVIDQYEVLLDDLFTIRTPHTKFMVDYKEELDEFVSDYLAGKNIIDVGEWFFFPWNGLLVHYLPDQEHQEVRTARNRNIITEDEQKKFYNYRVAIAGLSVGSHPALTMGMMGGPKMMKLADPDVLGPSNLNRLRYDFTTIGDKKVDLVVNTLWQMNPYGDYHRYSVGVTTGNIDQFLEGVDLLVEEVDNLEMKIRLRLEARKRGIPVIMATDNGDNVIVDIERFDLEKNLELFNGIAGHIDLEEFQKIKPADLPKLATKIAGKDMVMPRMLDSLLGVGKTLYSWPQLGDAATLAGVSLAYITKRLALGESLRSGKLEVNLDKIFDPDYDLPENQGRRDANRSQFAKIIGLE
ncbi:ThiF family adenylyltransferase [Candidatus Nomurabacteria bacterium]|nr:ThiF family adenylyltransferase [Candidatus Nomurabacteria bacterium]